jgi:uncharacterized protein with PhoU and TrkA domain
MSRNSTIPEKELVERHVMFDRFKAAEEQKQLESKLECLNYSIKWFTARKLQIEARLEALREIETSGV